MDTTPDIVRDGTWLDTWLLSGARSAICRVEAKGEGQPCQQAATSIACGCGAFKFSMPPATSAHGAWATSEPCARQARIKQRGPSAGAGRAPDAPTCSAYVLGALLRGAAHGSSSAARRWSGTPGPVCSGARGTTGSVWSLARGTTHVGSKLAPLEKRISTKKRSGLSRDTCGGTQGGAGWAGVRVAEGICGMACCKARVMCERARAVQSLRCQDGPRRVCRT
jgi:hypothetical protein